jgi:diguanylate cyclase (GGDEF)-like protein
MVRRGNYGMTAGSRGDFTSRWQFYLGLALIFGAGFIAIYGNYWLRTCPRLPFHMEAEDLRLTVRQADPDCPLRPGDILASIDGMPMDEHCRSYPLTGLLRGGSEYDFVVYRNGQEVALRLFIPPFYPPAITWLILLVAIAILAVSLFTFFLKNDTPAMLNFVAAQACLAILSASLHPSTYVVFLYFWIFFFLAPPLLFRMIAVLPEDEYLWQRMRRPYQIFMGWGILAAVLAAAYVTGRHLHEMYFLGHQEIFSRFWLLLTIFNGLVIFAMAALAATRTFQWVRSLPARRKLKWVLWGTVAGVGPYILFYYIPHHMLDIYGDQAIKIALSVTFPFFILVPLATAGVVIRYHFFDIDFLVRKTITYFLTMLVLSVASFLAAIAAGHWLMPEAATGLPFYWVIPLLMTLFFWPLQMQIKRLVERRYQKFDYDLLETLEKLSSQLCDTTSREDVMEVAARFITRLTPPERLLFVFQDRAGGITPGHSVNVPRPFLDWLQKTRFDSLFGGGDSQATATFALHSITADFLLTLPLHVAGQPRGLLLLGRKSGPSAYSEKDNRFLNILADQVSLALRSVGSVEIPPEETTADPAQTLNTFWQRIQTLKQEKEHLEKLAITDPLTGFYNRRILYTALQGEIHRAQRFSESFGLLMMDLDHFKRVNDTLGHAAGDQVLKTVAETIRRSIRLTDLPCRFGGEEFVILLPHVTPSGLKQAADKVRQAVEGCEIKAGSETVCITISIGASIFPSLAPAPDTSTNLLLHQSDRALYYAKYHGRNQSILYDDLPDSWKFSSPPPVPENGDV